MLVKIKGKYLNMWFSNYIIYFLDKNKIKIFRIVDIIFYNLYFFILNIVVLLIFWGFNFS